MSDEYLRELFGPNEEQIWQTLNNELAATTPEDMMWRGAKVEARAGAWTVTMDVVVEDTENTGSPYSHIDGLDDEQPIPDVVYTRLRAPFVNADSFRFRIYRASIFSALGSLLGMQDIEIGDEFFDREFVIQGSDEELVKKLFADPKLRALIQQQPDVHLEVKDDEGIFGQDFPEGVDELYFRTDGIVSDREKLRQLYDLFARCLNRLCQMGAAYKDDPGIDL